MGVTVLGAASLTSQAGLVFQAPPGARQNMGPAWPALQPARRMLLQRPAGLIVQRAACCSDLLCTLLVTMLYSAPPQLLSQARHW